MNRHAGFNLFELLITLTIISILSALCLPSYFQHIANERRLEAEMNLVKLANALERYRITNGSYLGATLVELRIPEFIANKQYKITLASVNDNDYVAQAIPQDKQLNDECGMLSLDSIGNKSHSGSGSDKDCW